MALRKCKLCGNVILKEDYDKAIPYKNMGYVHEKCFNISLKAIKLDKDQKLEESNSKRGTKRKPKAELKDAIDEEDYQDKKKLYEYMRGYVHLEDNNLPVKVYALVEKYRGQYNLSYQTILDTLIYIREIKEKEIVDDGIGLIPYYFDEAKFYYKSLLLTEENNKDKKLSEMYKEKVVNIQPKQKKIKQISIEDI